MGILSLIPLNTHILDPLKMALTDISFNDLSFTTIKTKKADVIDDKIIMVNIGEAERSELAKLIETLSRYKTKAIGLDILFLSAKEDSADANLATAIRNSAGIVLSDMIEGDNASSYTRNYFSRYAAHSGYVNFVGEDKGVIRYFSPVEKIGDTVCLSFAAAIARVADEDRFQQLIKRDKEVELINYKRAATEFFVVEHGDILANNVDSSLFRGKVVIVGYINKDPNNIEDKHFTPLNKKFVGKSVPDMNGAIIQANIISMILNKDYITRTPWWINWTFAFLFTWLFIAIIIGYYIEKHIWFHIVAKTIQLILTVLFIYIGIVCTKYLHLSINFTAILLAIILSVDVLYFFEGFTNWLHKKFGLSSVFIKTHH